MRLWILITLAALAWLASSQFVAGGEIYQAWAALAVLIGAAFLSAALIGRLIRRVTKARTYSDNHVILDGSNVMHWRDGTPSIDVVARLVDLLRQQGYVPRVIFDANAGYKLFDHYMNDRALAKHLGLPQRHVMVVPKGTPADGFILQAARDYKARIITNDQYRDWVDQFPEIATPGLLVKGEMRDGKLYVTFPEWAGHP